MMSDTYARVMRATDGSGDRRPARSRAPQRPTAVSDCMAGISVMTGTPLETAQDKEQDSAAETTFAAAGAAFAAGQDGQCRAGLGFGGGPAPKRLGPHPPAAAAPRPAGEG